MTCEQGYDVIVVGAGPGGFATALVAARSGLRVLVLDRQRFPRDKVCGDAITPLGMTMLAQLGVLDAVRAVADEQVSTIQSVRTHDGENRSLATDVLVVRRRVLDAALLDLVRPLVEVREGHAVEALQWRDGQVCGVAGRTDRGERFAAMAAVVVGADGASSNVARLTGCRGGRSDEILVATRGYYRGVEMPARALEFHFLPELGGGYLWIFPVGGDRYNVGLGGVADRLRRDRRTLRGWCQDVLASPVFASRFAAASAPNDIAGGQIPFGGTTQQIAGGGFLLVGDAAGLADAFWGDGIDTALASGALAGAHLAAACKARDVGAERLAGYRRSVLRVLGPKLTRSLERQRATADDLAALPADPSGAL